MSHSFAYPIFIYLKTHFFLKRGFIFPQKMLNAFLVIFHRCIYFVLIGYLIYTAYISYPVSRFPSY